MNTIGRNYEVSLSSATNNTYEFYVPLDLAGLTIDELRSNALFLQSKVEEWTAISEDTSKNATERNNARAIVQILQGRLDNYNHEIAARESSTGGGDGVYPQDPIEGGGDGGSDTGGSSKTWLLILGAAAAAWFLFGKSKGRRNQVATRKKVKR